MTGILSVFTALTLLLPPSQMDVRNLGIPPTVEKASTWKSWMIRARHSRDAYKTFPTIQCAWRFEEAPPIGGTGSGIGHDGSSRPPCDVMTPGRCG